MSIVLNTVSFRRRLLFLIGGASILFALVFVLKGISSADSLPNTGAPSGFTLTSVATGFDAPTSAQFAPDGRIFVIQKNGVVKIIKNGQVLSQPFYTTPKVSTYIDRGMLGLALDPNFATNGYVYLLYTYDNPTAQDGIKNGRLLRVTASGDKAVVGSEQIILGSVVGTAASPSCDNYPLNTDCMPADYYSHGPDTLAFGPDGKLYVSIGESSNYNSVDTKAYRAQNLDSMAGKVLRINPDGSAPADNPYYDGNATHIRSKVYAYGFRNPFRLNIRPSDGLVVVGDVGWALWEEVNIVTPGANFGWPCYEGNEQQNGTGDGANKYKNQPFCQQMYQNVPTNLKYPLYLYAHPPSSAVVGGVFYTGNKYPAQYKNRYFYADYAKNQMYSLALDAANALVPNSNQLFASNAAGPVSFFTGPDGDIYFTGINNGGIYRVNYATSNQPPTAFMAADKTFGASPLAVNFDSSGSSDPENDPLTFSWDFGDNSPKSTSPNPSHTFTGNGTYTVTLTISDPFNNKSTKTIDIHVGQTAPTLTIASPSDFTVATPEQPINFSGSATDAQDGLINDDRLKWQVDIQHCPLNSCHTHSVLTTTGPGGSFNFPPHDGTFYVQITLSVTNSVGLTSTKFVTVYPQGQNISHAMQFDGINDYVLADNPADFKLQQFTAEAMVKTLTTDTDGAEVMSMGNNWMLRILPSGGLNLSFNSAGTWQEVNALSVQAKDGIWHHVAVTKTLTDVKLYFDGAVVAQVANNKPIDYVYGEDFVIGRHGTGEDNYSFNGALDELRVWAVPRTDAEVAAYQSSSLPASGLTGLVGYYTAEEGNGTTSADSSPNKAHKLTFINGTSWTAGAPLAGSTSPPPVTTPISQLKETFTGTSIDTTKWELVGPAGNTAQNSVLTISPAANTVGYYGLKTKGSFDLRAGSIFAEAVQTTTATGAETQMVLELDASNRIVIGRTDSQLLLRQTVNGANSDTTLAYDSTAMRFWRIREAGGSVFLETSPDTTTWTSRRSLTPGFDLSQLKAILLAGTYQPLATPGAAKFDNLNTVPPPPVSTINNSLSVNGTSTGKATVNGGGLYDLQQFTVETWVKAKTTGTGGAEVLSNGNNYGIRVRTNGNLVFFVHNGNKVWTEHTLTGINLKDNVWHHIAITKDASSIKLYVDSVLKKTVSTTKAISYTLGTTMTLGHHSTGDNAFNLTGQIDETRIWNSARTLAQIQASWNKELTLPQSGLVGYWQFNEASGTTAIDGSGNNKPLVFAAGASRVAGFPKQ